MFVAAEEACCGLKVLDGLFSENTGSATNGNRNKHHERYSIIIIHKGGFGESDETLSALTVFCILRQYRYTFTVLQDTFLLLRCDVEESELCQCGAMETVRHFLPGN